MYRLGFQPNITAGILAIGLGIAGSAAGAQETTQILDRIFTYNANSVLEMDVSSADFDLLVDDPGAKLAACTLTATRGLWCLDGSAVVNWPNPADAASKRSVLDCTDPALGFNERKGEPCIGLALDTAGALYLSGRDRGSSYKLVKVVAKVDGLCPADGFFAPLAGSPDYCVRDLATGRPLLDDLSRVDAEAADRLNPSCEFCPVSGSGTFGLEERSTAVFFPDDGDPVEFVRGKRDWTLQGNEQVMSLALLQLPNAEGGFDSLVLATTSIARILAAETDGTPDVREVFDIAAQRRPSSVLCSAGDPKYGVRVDRESGRSFVTDRNYCELSVLEPVTDATGALTALANVQQDGGDLTLSTSGEAGTFPPDGPTVAEGIGIDLADCAVECTLVEGAGGKPAATLSNVTLVGSETGLTLFQIQGIPDCRYIPDACVALLDGVDSPADLKAQGVILDMPGGDSAPAQLLNVSKLLPDGFADLIPSGDLPDLWIPRWYRGQETNGFLFDAFFGLTDASFAGIAELELFVADLTGRDELGCPVETPDDGTPVSVLRSYDLAVKASEDFISVERGFIPGAGDHEAMPIPIGCGSSRSGFDRWSLVPVNLEFVPDTFDADTFMVTENDDALFAKILLSLFDDLRDSIGQLACRAVDGQSAAPLSESDCAALDQQWVVTNDKLVKCIDAARQPKTSLKNENCRSFESQLANFIDDWSRLTVSGEDPANRLGEVGLRLRVVENVYFNLFFPSIPDGGFQN